MTATNGSDYRTRFIREYRELDERIGNLAAMIRRHKTGTLDFTPDSPIELFERQLHVMIDYRQILEARAENERIDLTSHR